MYRSTARKRSCKHTAITILDVRFIVCGPRRDCFLGNCVARRQYDKRKAVFSVLQCPCQFERKIESREWEFNDVQRTTTE